VSLQRKLQGGQQMEPATVHMKAVLEQQQQQQQQRTVDAPTLNAFKNGLPRIRDNSMGFFMD